jgi:predicted TIM-barrel fold metal-dependent hydrolase
MISADCHAGPPPDTYREYLERAVHDDYSAWLAEVEENQRKKQTLFAPEFRKEFDAEGASGLSGAWDSDQRILELEADGTVAEVIFPDSIVAGGVPFGAGIMMNQREIDPRLTQAGAQAHNRWLADLCAAAPGRRAGIAPIPIADIEAAVEEIHRVRAALPIGGILLPAATGSLPLYHHPRYEPIWEACEEVGLPVHIHSGSGTPDYGDYSFSPMLFVCETSWFAHRPLTFVMWAGVFERHPKLKWVMTEQGAGWIPSLLGRWDSLYDQPMFQHLRGELSLKPSEYWARQCSVGASMLSRAECEVRHRIGVDTIMWGSDYPHPEGTWPHTKERIHQTFSGVPEAEMRAMLGENAARVYGFDPEALASVAERVCPRPEDI